MAIFNSKLLVHQRVHLSCFCRAVSTRLKCVCFPPVIRLVNRCRGPARSSPRNSSEFLVLLMHIPIYFPGLTWGPSDVMGHPFWGHSAAPRKRTPNAFGFRSFKDALRAHRRPCSKIFLKEHLFSWTLICAQMKLQVYKNSMVFLGCRVTLHMTS